MEQISPISASGFVELFLGLLVVIFLIFLLAFAFKRFGSGSLGMGGVIKVLAALSLGNRDKIALISVGTKQMLIGISPGRISKLHVFDESIDLEVEKAGTDLSGDFKAELANKIQSLMSGDRA